MFACVNLNLSAVPKIGTVWRHQKWGLQAAPKMGPSGGPQIRPLPSQYSTLLNFPRSSRTAKRPIVFGRAGRRHFWGRQTALVLGPLDGTIFGAARTSEIEPFQ